MPYPQTFTTMQYIAAVSNECPIKMNVIQIQTKNIEIV